MSRWMKALLVTIAMPIITGLISNAVYDLYRAKFRQSGLPLPKSLPLAGAVNTTPWSQRKWWTSELGGGTVLTFSGNKLVAKSMVTLGNGRSGEKVVVYTAKSEKRDEFRPDDPAVSASETCVSVIATTDDELILAAEHTSPPLKTIVTCTPLNDRVKAFIWSGIIVSVIGANISLIILRSKDAILNADLGWLGNLMAFGFFGRRFNYYIWCFDVIAFTIFGSIFLFGAAIYYYNF